MTTTELDEIKERIETAKNRKARAEGALEKIKEQWKRDFGVETFQEAEAKLEELQAAIAKDETRLAELEESLSKVTDWDEI